MGQKQTHTLSVGNLTAHITREIRAGSSLFPIHDLRWTASPAEPEHSHAGLIPEQDVGGKDKGNAVTNSGFAPVICSWQAWRAYARLAAKLSPALGDVWCSTQPSGTNTLALDIPASGGRQDPFQASWSDLA
ncbi:hypothetical protein ACNKHU_20125 [Shigella flexneri]